jgi:hypothetical protein
VGGNPQSGTVTEHGNGSRANDFAGKHGKFNALAVD